MSLYSKFDKSIGHFRRYEKKDFEKFNLGNSKIVKMFYIDSIGYILYKIHSFFCRLHISKSTFYYDMG